MAFPDAFEMANTIEWDLQPILIQQVSLSISTDSLFIFNVQTKPLTTTEER